MPEAKVGESVPEFIVRLESVASLEGELPEARHVSIIEADPCEVTALPDRVDPMTLKLYSDVTLIGMMTVLSTSAPELGL